MKANLYQRDFHEWAIQNAHLLQAHRFADIDIEHIAEELMSMGRSEQREFLSRLAILLAHLLKWQHQANLRSRSWQLTIKEQRRALARCLHDSPSLKKEIKQTLTEAYEDAVLLACKDTGLEEDFFSPKIPYSFAQIMDVDFFPEHN
jgi:hypothetical protein